MIKRLAGILMALQQVETRGQSSDIIVDCKKELADVINEMNSSEVNNDEQISNK